MKGMANINRPNHLSVAHQFCRKLGYKRISHPFVNNWKKYNAHSGYPILWHVTLCSPLKVNRRFGSACHLLLRWFLGGLSLRPARWRRYVPPKRELTFSGLHSVIS
jgi:hypothetical protein